MIVSEYVYLLKCARAEMSKPAHEAHQRFGTRSIPLNPIIAHVERWMLLPKFDLIFCERCIWRRKKIQSLQVPIVLVSTLNHGLVLFRNLLHVTTGRN